MIERSRDHFTQDDNQHHVRFYLNFYLSKYGFLPPQLTGKPDAGLGIIVVIPCFNEPDLVSSLQSIASCETPSCHVEVITVINCGEHHADPIKKQNQLTLEEAQRWSKNQDQSRISFHFIHLDNLPKKHAGVGLARKIGMDEAVARFDKMGKDGIIVCFDADSLCDSNYLIEIEKHFEKFPKAPGCSIRFEHPLSGAESDVIYQGIAQYELHLRYYNQALRFCNLPYAFHTVGSSMAVRSSAYQKQGGMNKRQAGEDFYFLHKIIRLGNFTELNSTRVIPSPRISDRVPFGTGKAIGDYVSDSREVLETYNFKSFVLIREFVAELPQLYELDPVQLPLLQFSSTEAKVLLRFFESENLLSDLREIRKNSPTEAAFVKRFWNWFDAFRVLKLVHFLRDELYPNQPVTEATLSLLRASGITTSGASATDLLLLFREIEAASDWGN